MGIQASLHVEGSGELAATMAKMDRQIQRVGYEEILYQWGETLLAEVLARVPVDEGDLKRAIKSHQPRIWPDGNGGSVMVGTDAGAYKGDQFYASMVEYGHRIGKRGKFHADPNKSAKSAEDYRYTKRGARWIYGKSRGFMYDNQGRRAAIPESAMRAMKTVRRVPPHPYMRPAQDAVAPRLMPMAREILAGLLSRLGGKAA